MQFLWHSQLVALSGTYEEAQGGRAGWEGREELQDTEVGVSQVSVVVGGALLAAELLQSPSLPAVSRVLHQRPEKRLVGGAVDWESSHRKTFSICIGGNEAKSWLSFRSRQ